MRKYAAFHEYHSRQSFCDHPAVPNHFISRTRTSEHKYADPDTFRSNIFKSKLKIENLYKIFGRKKVIEPDKKPADPPENRSKPSNLSPSQPAPSSGIYDELQLELNNISMDQPIVKEPSGIYDEITGPARSLTPNNIPVEPPKVPPKLSEQALLVPNKPTANIYQKIYFINSTPSPSPSPPKSPSDVELPVGIFGEETKLANVISDHKAEDIPNEQSKVVDLLLPELFENFHKNVQNLPARTPSPPKQPLNNPVDNFSFEGKVKSDDILQKNRCPKTMEKLPTVGKVGRHPNEIEFNKSKVRIT